MSLTHDRLTFLLDYDPESGIFSWKERTSNRIKVGDKCLNKDSHGYVRIRIDTELYSAARLAWFYVHKKWPPNDIDHINGVRDDNRICNLREATRSQNLANKLGKYPGQKGVCFIKRTRRWLATVCKEGQIVFNKSYPTKEEALSAYREAARIHFGEFARFPEQEPPERETGQSNGDGSV